MDYDFGYNYSHIKIKKNKKEVIEAIQISFSILEKCVASTIECHAKKNDTDQDIKKFYTFKKRIDYLKKKKLITTEVHQIMTILAKIRNKLFHEPFTDKTIFITLQEIEINNDFVTNLKNDARKYQLLSSYCSIFMCELQEKIAPEEILQLEATEETKFEPYDAFS